MAQTCIKVCGLTTREQVKDCVDLGVNWLGFNCYPGSKRYIVPEKIRELLDIVPFDVKTVGVFVNGSVQKVNQIMEYTGMQLVQLHGDESPEYAKALTHEYIRAFRVSSCFQPNQISHFPLTYFLLDSYHPNHYGGTGKSFNWEIAKKSKKFGRLILAGGLNPENVQEAITSVRPFGVDVCSGVESTPGLKDWNRVATFISAVRKADQFSI